MAQSQTNPIMWQVYWEKGKGGFWERVEGKKREEDREEETSIQLWCIHRGMWCRVMSHVRRNKRRMAGAVLSAGDDMSHRWVWRLAVKMCLMLTFLSFSYHKERARWVDGETGIGASDLLNWFLLSRGWSQFWVTTDPSHWDSSNSHSQQASLWTVVGNPVEGTD